MASFTKGCGCKRHLEFTKGEKFDLIKISAKKIKKSVIDELRNDDLITKNTTYLCKGCINHTEQHKIDQTTIPIKKVVENVRNGTYNSEILKEIASALGESQRHVIHQEAKTSTYDYKQLSNLSNFDSESYIHSKNAILVAFLMSLAGSEDGDRILLYIVFAIDCIYASVYPRYISMLCFMISMLSYIMTGSKTVCRFLSSVSPSGCYNTLLNWFHEHSCEMQKPPEDVDIVTFFDNNQILSRNWNIKYDSKALVSVITTSINIIPPSPSKLQFNASLSPSSWLYSNKDPILLASKINAFISHYENIYDKYRLGFLSELLEKVDKEVSYGSEFHEKVGVGTQIPSCHTGSAKLVTGDPIFLNPCSYKAVGEVLGVIKDNNCGGERKWSMIGCDGLPYILGSRLIEQDVNLQDIYLIPGLGHFEINMTRSIFKLLWDVLLEAVAKLMGLRSVRALTSCQRCSDHHKSWQLLMIVMSAVSKELVVPYIKTCHEEKKTPDCQEFLQYARTNTTPNYSFLFHVMITYVFALILFRAGQRMNNSDAILAFRVKFSSLFFGLNQTFYQEIEMRDTIARILSPSQVSDFITNNETFTVSGIATKGEGGDFILEAKNRKIKRMMPSGHPTNETWKRVCKNADTTDKVREKIHSILGWEADPSVSHNQENPSAIASVRKLLKETQYFSASSSHTSISGASLDIDLKDFASHCKGNRELYIDDIRSGKGIGKGEKLTPLFVLPRHRQDFMSMENKTKAELQKIINNIIEEIYQLGSTAVSHNLKVMWKDIKTATKPVYLSFYRECVVALENATSLNEDDEEEDTT